MLATTLGVDFDLGQIWNKEKSLYKLSDKLTVRTRNITQTAEGKKGLWTTAFAAAIFIP
jgi:arginine decarboxylase